MTRLLRRSEDLENQQSLVLSKWWKQVLFVTVILAFVNVGVYQRKLEEFTQSDLQGQSTTSTTAEWIAQKLQESWAMLNQEEEKEEVTNKPRHWCVIQPRTLPVRPAHFQHFPHASEALLPCWSWFREHKATDKCGFVLLDGLSLETPGYNKTWHAQLVEKMGCKVEFQMPDATTTNTTNDVYHAVNLLRLKPRHVTRYYLQEPADAHALRDRVLHKNVTISNQRIDAFYLTRQAWAHNMVDPLMPLDESNNPEDHDRRLQIGLVLRSGSRKITNIVQLTTALRKALPGADVHLKISSEWKSGIQEQALWFASHDVIIGAHGAEMANTLFIRPGTVVVQLFPPNFHWQTMEPLVEQAGGIALNWGAGGPGNFGKWKDIQFRNDYKARNYAMTQDFNVNIEEMLEMFRVMAGGEPSDKMVSLRREY